MLSISRGVFEKSDVFFPKTMILSYLLHVHVFKFSTYEYLLNELDFNYLIMNY